MGRLMASGRYFLDETVDERGERNSEFPNLVEAALRRRQLLRELAARREKLGLLQTLVAARMGPPVGRTPCGQCVPPLARSTTYSSGSSTPGGRPWMT